VRENPLEDVARLANIDGVCARGRWLDRRDLDAMLAQVADIYNPDPLPTTVPTPGKAEVDAFVDGLRKLHASGYVFRDHDLREIGRLLESAGRGEDSLAILAMRTDPSPPSGN
jgi:hypothetical protein